MESCINISKILLRLKLVNNTLIEKKKIYLIALLGRTMRLECVTRSPVPDLTRSIPLPKCLIGPHALAIYVVRFIPNDRVVSCSSVSLPYLSSSCCQLPDLAAISPNSAEFAPGIVLQTPIQHSRFYVRSPILKITTYEIHEPLEPIYTKMLVEIKQT